MQHRGDDMERPFEPGRSWLETSCLACGLLHRPQEPLAFDSLCLPCAGSR
jgi:hypothetical protein